jgi:hypothetical protein
MSVQEAKSRLLELGQRKSSLAIALVRPALRGGAMLLAGAYLGRQLRNPHRDHSASSRVTLLNRAAATAAPFLVDQFVRGVMGHVAKGDSVHASSSGRNADPSCQ